jgi:hypothetical protein
MLNKLFQYWLVTYYVESCRHYSVATRIAWDEAETSWVLNGRGNVTTGSYKHCLTPAQVIKHIASFKITATKKRTAERCMAGGVPSVVWHGNNHSYHEGVLCDECGGSGIVRDENRFKLQCPTCEGSKLIA